MADERQTHIGFGLNLQGLAAMVLQIESKTKHGTTQQNTITTKTSERSDMMNMELIDEL